MPGKLPLTIFLLTSFSHLVFGSPAMKGRIEKIDEEVRDLHQHELYFRGKANEELRKSQAYFQDDLRKYAADIKDLGHYNKIAEEIEEQIRILEEEKKELLKHN